jgi:MerR family transcriptional regulator, copper efflux regulator
MTVRLPIAPVSVPAQAAAESSVSLMQVGDLAKETGKSVRALHLYEELELLRPQARSKGGFRLYGQDSVRRIRWIGRLQELGFSLGDIQGLAKDFETSAVAPAAMVRVRQQYADKLAATREQIERLRQLERDLEKSLSFLEACDSVCEPETVIRACTSCDHHDCHDPMPELVAGLHAS